MLICKLRRAKFKVAYAIGLFCAKYILIIVNINITVKHELLNNHFLFYLKQHNNDECVVCRFVV